MCKMSSQVEIIVPMWCRIKCEKLKEINRHEQEKIEYVNIAHYVYCVRHSCLCVCIFYSSMCGYASMCNIFCYHLLLSILANYSNLLRAIVMQFRNAKKKIPKPIHFNNRSLSMILIIIFHHSISCYLKLHWKKFVYPFEFVPQRKPIDEILTDKEKRFLISHCVCGTM